MLLTDFHIRIESVLEHIYNLHRNRKERVKKIKVDNSCLCLCEQSKTSMRAGGGYYGKS